MPKGQTEGGSTAPQASAEDEPLNTETPGIMRFPSSTRPYFGKNILDSGRHRYQDTLEGYFDSPEDSPPSWLFMMRAYIDESGQQSKGWMFLAGYLGNEKQWKRFSEVWRAALGQRKHLHLHDLRWKHVRTKRLLERLGPIPEQCGLTPVLSGLCFGHYEDLIAGGPAEKLLKGWLACLQPLVLQMLRVIPENERLEIVFEEQKEYEPYAHVIFASDLAVPNHEWKRTEDGRPKIAKWSFVPKGSTILTDPADYLAFALREVYTDRHSKKSEWCAPILKSGSGIGKIFKRSEIRSNITNTLLVATYRTIVQQMEKMYGHRSV